MEQLKEKERKEAIDAAVKAGKKKVDEPFINGYEGFMFKPDNNMTRAEACAVVTRLLVDENTIKGKNTSKFTDVESGSWYYDYVAYLENNGYLDAYTGTFSPNQPITRAEFVELVYNMGKVSDTGKTLTFKDVDASHPRYKVIMAAASAGLVNGRDDGTFDPDGTIKRSEVVKVLCAALGRTPTEDSFIDVSVVGFADIDSKHWAYPYVIESAYEHESVPDSNGNEIWVSLTDNNEYFKEVPDGLIDKLEAEFEKRKNEILNTKSEWTVAEGGTVWYVSSSEGENTNDGKSPETPIRTLAKLMQWQDRGRIKAGDVVLFKRGDEWHDKLTCAVGVSYSAYGEGEKPRILGSIEADNENQWKETDTAGVYKYYVEIKRDSDVGNIVFNDGECYGMRVLPQNGITLKTGSDDIVSNGINKWKLEPRSFTGYADLAKIAADIPESDLMYYHDWDASALYLYSRTGNPGARFESIELCTHGNAIRATSNNVIDNLCIKYTGSHGVGAGSCENLTVRNCEIGFIGGSVQSPTRGLARYGNGIEIYGSADGYYVYNNYVYQCFDCGPTVQWSGTLTKGQTIVEKDVLIHDNVLREASLEVWLSTNQENTDDTYAKLINCRMYNNYVTGSGTGFKAYNHQKYEWTSFYGGGGTKAPYIDCYIENNYFWNNQRHLMKSVPTSAKENKGFIWRNNTIIHPFEEGSIGYMGSDYVNATGTRVQYFYDKDTVNTLVKEGALGVNRFYYTPGSAANRRYFEDAGQHVSNYYSEGKIVPIE